MQRETMETDVLIVGGGPAGLAAAIQVARRIKAHNAEIESGQSDAQPIPFEDRVMVIEKGSYVGAHGFSGAIMDPSGMDQLIPDWKEKAPIEGFVSKDDFFYFTKSRAIKTPVPIPGMNNMGKPIASLAKVAQWLGEVAEEEGVLVMPGFAGVELIIENGQCVGIITDDKGYENGVATEPGVEIRAAITILCEGPRGTLTKQAFDAFGLMEGRRPDQYELGVKEIWKMPAGSVPGGRVFHSVGYPLDKHTSGGSFVYDLTDDHLAVGFVTYLSSRDPYLDAHRKLQEFKAHPFMRKYLEGGEMVHYGAKAIPGAGYHSIPKLYASGMMIAGDSAMMCNSQRLKGIHSAIHTGMMAADTAYDALLSGDFGEQSLSAYSERFESSELKKELHKARNFTVAMEQGFPFPAVFDIGVQLVTGGRSIFEGEARYHSDAHRTVTLEEFYGAKRGPDAAVKDDGYLVAKLSDVFRSNTAHDEAQPSHLKVANTEYCATECHPNWGSPCTHFCPASVYEMVGREGNGRHDLRVNFSNCVHCKTCDIKCPVDNITWTPPQGGEGPAYELT